jgi:hypothetical protein
MRNSDNRSIPKSGEEIQFGSLARRWRDDIKMDLKEKAVNMWVGFCKQCGEPSRFIQTFDQLSYFQLLKKDPDS